MELTEKWYFLKNAVGDVRAFKSGKVPKQYFIAQRFLTNSAASIASTDQMLEGRAEQELQNSLIWHQNEICGIYIACRNFIAHPITPIGTIGVEEDEYKNPFIEDFSSFRLHKRIERNARLSAEVKKNHGYTCEACGCDFAKVYPGIEKNRHIEAHHLIPVSRLKRPKS